MMWQSVKTAASIALAVPVVFKLKTTMITQYTIPVRSPFTEEDLELLVENDSKLQDRFRKLLEGLLSVVDTAAECGAKANSKWHDDPDAVDHEAYHAPASVQFPREIRLRALKQLIETHLDAIEDNFGRFWPEDFAKLKCGDFIRMTYGFPAVVIKEPHGLNNSWITVAYRHEADGLEVHKDLNWNEISQKL